MAPLGLRTAIWQNNMRTLYLISLLPLIVLIILFVYVYMGHGTINSLFRDDFASLSTGGLIIMAIWLIIGVLMQKRIIFGFTGAQEIARKDAPEVYNIVENLCISRGLPTPKIGIINDDSLNAFATGRTPKNARIVFSRGLLNKLDAKEVEAVAGHELTHILNGDIKSMVIINVFIGAIGTIGSILMRTGGSSKKKNPLPLLGLLLYLVSVILFPFINLAISRKKEFLADAGSVELTHDKYAMISALQKISSDATIENVKNQSDSVAAMFISNPKPRSSHSWMSKLFLTHPPIEDRIKALEIY